MTASKRIKENKSLVDRRKRYSVGEAVAILKQCQSTKFDESIEVAIRLGVNPKHADQMVRGTVALPHGTGKSVRIAVFAEGEKAAEAKEAGADFVGGEDLAEKVKGGWLDFDVAVATPDMMRVLGKLGKVLGPRGLMPNPKAGTVTMDLTRALKELKGGRIEYRIDRQANIAAAVGKISFEAQQIEENVLAFIEAIVKARPTAVKGAYFLGASVCSAMSPGIKLDHQEILAAMKK